MRILIIRFSSFGDIFQALEAAVHIKRADPTATIDWLVRHDFAKLLEGQESIDQVIPFDRKQSAFALIKTSWHLAPHYVRVYDAHTNLRSLIVRTVIRLYWLTHIFSTKQSQSIIKRPKDRIRRQLFFRFRLPVLPAPFRGAESFLRPLRTWYPKMKFSFTSSGWTPQPSRLPDDQILSDFQNWKKNVDGLVVAFAPSAAWPNKRWPIDRWMTLANTWLKSHPESRFLLLGGPDDKFLNEIATELGPGKVFNAVGKSSLNQSASLLSLADALVANDTGLLHVADRLLKPTVAIIGPTAFGYPSGPYSRVAEVSLACKPCSKDGRDRCTNSENLKCLKLVSPEQVTRLLQEAIDTHLAKKGELLV